LQGEQWRDLLLSPKRDLLTQVRLAEIGQGYTRTLAQAVNSCFERGLCAKGGLAQARRARLSELVQMATVPECRALA